MDNSSLEFYFTGEQVVGAIGAKIARIEKSRKILKGQWEIDQIERNKNVELSVKIWNDFQAQSRKWESLSFFRKLFTKEPVCPSGLNFNSIVPSYTTECDTILADLRRDILLFNDSDQEEYLLTREQAYFYGLPEYFSGCGPGK